MEACWAHNPEVRESKPRSAKSLTLPTYYILLEIIIFGNCYFNICIYFCQAERLCKLQLSSFFDKCVWLYWDFTLYGRVKANNLWLKEQSGAVKAWWAHITQRSVDRSYALLNLFRFFIIAHIPYFIINIIFFAFVILTCLFIFVKPRDYMQITVVFFFLTNLYDYIKILHYIEKWKPNKIAIYSRVAQWKRAGPITQRSVDWNHALLNHFRFFNIAHIPYFIRNNYFWHLLF